MHNKSNALKSGLAVCVALAVMLMSSPVYAALSGSSHDFTSSGPNPITGVNEKCSTCHVPHKPLLNVPLWAHALTTYSYYLYNSNPSYNTPNTGAYDAASSVATDLAGSRSRLCLSCHDGTVAVAGATYITQTSGTPPGSVWMLYDGGGKVGGLGSATPSSGLKGSHPIAVNYNTVSAGQPGEFNNPPTHADVKLEDTGTGPKVQCTSCHNPHNKYAKMLVIDNAGSALCLKCHNK